VTLIDSHCHPNGKELATDRGEVIARAIDSDVQAWVEMCNGPGDLSASHGLMSPEMAVARANLSEGFAWGARLK